MIILDERSEPPSMHTVRDKDRWLWLHSGERWVRHTTRDKLTWTELVNQYGPLHSAEHIFSGRPWFPGVPELSE